MNDIIKEYFTLNSSKSVDKGNGVAIFCAVVSIFACRYSLNLSNRVDNHLTQTKPAVRELDETNRKESVSSRIGKSSTTQSSYAN